MNSDMNGSFELNRGIIYCTKELKLDDSAQKLRCLLNSTKVSDELISFDKKNAWEKIISSVHAMIFARGYINRIQWRIQGFLTNPVIPAYEFVDLLTGGYMIYEAGKSMYTAIGCGEFLQNWNDNRLFGDTENNDDEYFKNIRAAAYEHTTDIKNKNALTRQIKNDKSDNFFSRFLDWRYYVEIKKLKAVIFMTANKPMKKEDYWDDTDSMAHEFDVEQVFEYIRDRHHCYTHDFMLQLEKKIKLELLEEDNRKWANSTVSQCI